MQLSTTSEVVKALGGIAAVAEMTGSSYNAACNWQAFPNFPPKTYLVLSRALRARGYSAPASLWGMVEREQA